MKYGSKTTLKEILKTKKNNLKRGTIITLFSTKFLLFLLSGHLSKILIVKGAVVHPRDVVGITGSTGRSTGEHLHITCKLNGRSISPSLILDYIQSIRQECISALAGL